MILRIYNKIKLHVSLENRRKIKKFVYPAYNLLFIGIYSLFYLLSEIISYFGIFSFKLKTIIKERRNKNVLPKNKRQHIGIDLRPLQLAGSNSRGIGFYTKHLSHEMFKVSKSKYKFVSYSLNEKISDNSSRISDNHYVIKRRSQRLLWLWNTAYIPSRLVEHNVSLFHATDPFCIIKPTKFYKSIATIYDVIPLIYPKKYLLPTTVYRRYAYARSYKTISSLNGIITISQHAKKDIVKYLGIPEEKIHVTLLAADVLYRPVNDRDMYQKVRNQYSINSDYILYVGGIDYRKNIVALLRAFAVVVSEYPKLKLVIVGNDIFNPLEPMKKVIDAEIVRLKLNNSLLLLGFVPSEDLAILYSNARLFVYPSLYEGFGLPVLEALACGCPVVCSSTSSLPEVAGEAAIFFNPSKKQEIVKAIVLVLKNNNLREELIYKSVIQAKKFSWKKTANETLQIYNKILNDEH